jgi:hypothetical protein
MFVYVCLYGQADTAVDQAPSSGLIQISAATAAIIITPYFPLLNTSLVEVMINDMSDILSIYYLAW